MLSWICSFMNSWMICHHAFHLGFFISKAWFCTLSKVLSNNNSSNSFNLLFILTCRMGLGLFNYTLIVSYWPFQSWIWIVKVCFFPFQTLYEQLLLFLELLTGLIQTNYGTLLLHVGLLHFVVIPHHLLKFSLETLQIIVSFPIELIEFSIFLM